MDSYCSHVYHKLIQLDMAITNQNNSIRKYKIIPLWKNIKEFPILSKETLKEIIEICKNLRNNHERPIFFSTILDTLSEDEVFINSLENELNEVWKLFEIYKIMKE